MVFKPLDSIDFDLGDLDPMLLTPREKESRAAAWGKINQLIIFISV